MPHVGRVLVVVMAAVLAGVVAGPARADSPPLPGRMAAIGDSISRAYDACCYYGDHPGQSWSTGATSYDGITSHYERLKRLTPAITGHAANDAVSGAKMSAAQDQAGQAVSQSAQYVTFLLGANDLCTSSPATMTPVDTFRSQFQQAMTTLMGQDPRPYVFVSSIPNIYRLWQVLRTNSVARWVWSTAHVCQSMLGATRTAAERQQVVEREQAFNQVLATTCAKYPGNCRWDGGAVYAYPFSASQVSTLDYFHPSLSGQAALAKVTWNASWWSGT